MKIALLNDTHFGVRNDSEAFRNYQLRFYNEIFFPYLKEHNIKTLVHLGDVVDRRKFINFQTASIFRKQFFDRLYDEKIDTHIIIGNHDTYFKNTNKVNAIENLSKEITIIMIAHRLSTILNSYKIYVIDNGAIVEQGTHKELVDKNGLYAFLFKTQFLGDKVE